MVRWQFPGAAQVQHVCTATVSGTFNSLSKVLCTFPSRYLFSIRLKRASSLRCDVPPHLRSHPREHDSLSTVRTQTHSIRRREFHPLSHPIPRGFGFVCLLDMCLHNTSWCKTTICRCEPLPVRSPLLRESCSVSFSPLTYMLKFSGCPNLRSGL